MNKKYDVVHARTSIIIYASLYLFIIDYNPLKESTIIYNSLQSLTIVSHYL